MRCPYCGSQEDRVLETRIQKEGECIRRRRLCLGCGQRYSTQEVLITQLPDVVKKNGMREPFSQEKLLNGVRAACFKRPIDKGDIQGLVDQIIRSARQSGLREISATELGKHVLRELKKRDHIAFVRFASVHFEFSDLNDFVERMGQEGSP